MKVDSYDIPENFYYLKEHEWILIEKAGTARIGITDYAQKALREITYFYPGKRGAKIERMETICKIESVKSVGISEEDILNLPVVKNFKTDVRFTL